MSDRLEEQLRAALRRQDAPEGFAERVLAEASRTRAVDIHRKSRWAWRGWVAWPGWAVALAATLILMSGVIWMRHNAQQQQARLEARRQVLYALQLASEKTAPAREALSQMGISLEEVRQ